MTTITHHCAHEDCGAEILSVAHAGTLAQPVEDDDIRGPTEQEQEGVTWALDHLLGLFDDPSVAAQYCEQTVKAVRAARRWWVGRHELRGQKQCPGGRWPKCEGQLEGGAADYPGHGTLYDYTTGEALRDATAEEETASIAAAEEDGGSGIIEIEGRSCYVTTP